MYGVGGAPESFSSDDEYYRHCVEIWAIGSIQLQRVCAANGAKYFHFLQPNQHILPLSKPMGGPELVKTTTDLSPFRIPVQMCYPLMQASAERLAREGVEFTDLTQVFANHPEPIYVDDCCHVSYAGDHILGEAISRRIASHYAAAAK